MKRGVKKKMMFERRVKRGRGCPRNSEGILRRVGQEERG